MHKHSHEDGHEHSHPHTARGERGLLISILLNILITAAQIAGGLISGSLALLSDAFHNFSDAGSMLISYFAILIGKRSKNTAKTYGYKRAEILAALFNVMILFAVCGYIIYEAVLRFKKPMVINPVIMISVALFGVLGNGISAILLLKDSKENINIKSAYLHLIGDAASSIAVVITAVILMFKPWFIADTIMSVLISLYIIRESFGVLMESVNVLMQATPRGQDAARIKQSLMTIKGLKISDIHHIHMWDITPGNTVFDAHVVVGRANLKNADKIIVAINKVLAKKFNIKHSTIQLESGVFRHCSTCDL
jgi:cobalt-zinc-cadmium efflux system protein